jgi:hypothetical protein
MRPLLVACTAVALTCPPAARAADVSGKFAVKDGATIAPEYAAAFETRDVRNPRQKVVEIVLSAAPVDAEAAVAALAPHTQVINQDALMRHDYILLWVRPDGHVSMNATLGETMTQYVEALGENLSAQIATNTADRVAARVFTPRPVTVMGGGTYTMDVTFAVTVTRGPSGTALPAGGGAPGHALAALDKAITKNDWGALQAGLAPETLARFDNSYDSAAEKADTAVSTLRAWLPKSGLTVTGGTLRSDVADLEVEGDMFPGQRAFYLARMRKSGTAWQLESASVVGTLQ